MKMTSYLAGLLIALPALGATSAAAEEVAVSSAQALAEAVKDAKAGDVITIAAGNYKVGTMRAATPGTAEARIAVRADRPGSVILEGTEERAFRVTAPYWTFENLVIRGSCAGEVTCAHAFHLVQNAHHTIIRNNRLIEWDAMIKGNGEKVPGGTAEAVYPEDVLIEGNDFYNSAVRQTDASVTFIDVVGGRRWTVRDNFIADFGKGGGNQISYGAFLKGGHVDGLFERNLVVCQWKHRGGTRLGLSFGGGGTGRQFRMCGDDTCETESYGGVMRNNIVVNCNDAGVYLNRARDTKLYANTIVATRGVHLRFPQSTAELVNNIIAGGVRDRDGGSHTKAGNLINYDPDGPLIDPVGGKFRLAIRRTVVDQGRPLAAVTDDFCGNPRVGAPDIGAIEYAEQPCDPGTRYPD